MRTFRYRRSVTSIMLVLLSALILAAFGLSLQSTEAAQACTPRGDWPIYTVARGDTLANIARRYNTSTATLISANCLTNPNRIFGGQRLRVPPGGTGISGSKPFSAIASYQRYENGFMIWLAFSGDIHVFYGQDNGTLATYPARMYGRLPDNPFFNVPSGRVRPILGFGKVWGNFQEVRDRLGWALAPERGYIARTAVRYGVRGFLITTPDGSEVGTIGSSWRFSNGEIPTLAPIPTLVPTAQGTPQVIPATFQRFENGFMLWRTDTGEIWAFIGDKQGSFTVFPPENFGDLPNNPQSETPPPGRRHPIMGFGKVWYNMPNIRPSLGWAALPEQSYTLTTRIHSQDALDVTVPGATIFVKSFPSGWTLASGALPAVPPIGPLPPVEQSFSATLTAASLTPISPPVTSTTTAAYQLYENGFMLWQQNDERVTVTVFFKDGSAQVVLKENYGGLPDNPVTDPTPENRGRPVNAFGRVWGNDAGVRGKLGWALGQEQGYTMSGYNNPMLIRLICPNLPDGRIITLQMLTVPTGGYLWREGNQCAG
jgi:hypothetical protein